MSSPIDFENRYSRQLQCLLLRIARKELLYVYVDLDGDGTVEQVPLFDGRLQDYFWEYDNNGLKLVQLRFYEMPTVVEG